MFDTKTDGDVTAADISAYRQQTAWIALAGRDLVAARRLSRLCRCVELSHVVRSREVFLAALQRRGMERFVQYITGGGVVVVVGFWLMEFFALGSPPWLLGAALAILGGAGLAFGIGREIEGVPY